MSRPELAVLENHFVGSSARGGQRLAVSSQLKLAAVANGYSVDVYDLAGSLHPAEDGYAFPLGCRTRLLATATHLEASPHDSSLVAAGCSTGLVCLIRLRRTSSKVFAHVTASSENTARRHEATGHAGITCLKWHPRVQGLLALIDEGVEGAVQVIHMRNGVLHRLLSPEGAELRPHSSGLPAVAVAWCTPTGSEDVPLLAVGDAHGCVCRLGARTPGKMPECQLRSSNLPPQTFWPPHRRR